MGGRSPTRPKHRRTAVLTAAAAFLLCAAPLNAQAPRPTLLAAATPFMPVEFHFSDPARDARYWQLYAEMDRTLAAFREARFAAMHAVAVPGPQPGSPQWYEARAQIAHAIQMRRPAREALEALIFFLRRERSHLSAEEAEAAYDIIRVNEDMVVATSDALVDLLGMLAGLRMDRWPP